MAVEVCRFGAGDEQLWDAYVQRSPRAGHCHLSGWRRVIRRSCGHRSAYLWARDDGEVKGVLPFIVFRGLRGERSLVSMPFLDDGGICADTQRTAVELGQAALRLLRTSGAAALELRHRWPSGLDLARLGSKVTLTLDLADDPQRMWAGFDAKLRNQIRKAQKSGLTASWTGMDGLGDFYDVFAQNMRDLGSPVHGRRFFATILEEFADGARVVLVRQGTRAVAGGLCLIFRDGLLMPWASSVRRYRALCPNDLLYWEVIRWASEKGLRRFDFGRSSPGSGTYYFKKQWGAAEEPLHWQQAGDGRTRSGFEDGEGSWQRLAVGAWKRLPVRVATMVGPALRGRISR